MSGCDSSVITLARSAGRVANYSESNFQHEANYSEEDSAPVGTAAESDFNEEMGLGYQSHAGSSESKGFLKSRKYLGDMELEFLCRDANFQRINAFRKSHELGTVSKSMIVKMHGYSGRVHTTPAFQKRIKCITEIAGLPHHLMDGSEWIPDDLKFKNSSVIRRGETGPKRPIHSDETWLSCLSSNISKVGDKRGRPKLADRATHEPLSEPPLIGDDLVTRLIDVKYQSPFVLPAEVEHVGKELADRSQIVQVGRLTESTPCEIHRLKEVPSSNGNLMIGIDMRGTQVVQDWINDSHQLVVIDTKEIWLDACSRVRRTDSKKKKAFNDRMNSLKDEPGFKDEKEKEKKVARTGMDLVTMAMKALYRKLQPIFTTHDQDDERRFESEQRRQITFVEIQQYIEEQERSGKKSAMNAHESLGLEIAKEVGKLWDRKVIQFQPGDGDLETGLHSFSEERVSMIVSTTKSSKNPEINKMVPDQDFHMDSDVRGLFTWLNCTPHHRNAVQNNKSYLGVYLNSAQCISAIRKLHDLHYSKFKSEFGSYKVNGKALHEAMRGKGSEEEKLARAWGTFVKDKLGNDERYLWKRAYLEVDEFDAIIAGLSTIHFGARYPLSFGAEAQEALQTESLHVRMHSYVGWHVDRSGKALQATTIDLRSHPIYQSALQFIDLNPFERLYFSDTHQSTLAASVESTGSERDNGTPGVRKRRR